MSQSVFKSATSRENFRTAYKEVLGRFPFEQTYVDTAYGRHMIFNATDYIIPFLQKEN